MGRSPSLDRIEARAPRSNKNLQHAIEFFLLTFLNPKLGHFPRKGTMSHKRSGLVIPAKTRVIVPCFQMGKKLKVHWRINSANIE